jgi:outer membrane protein OmpA-like peptidoglycan-associated protein
LCKHSEEKPPSIHQTQKNTSTTDYVYLPDSFYIKKGVYHEIASRKWVIVKKKTRKITQLTPELKKPALSINLGEVFHSKNKAVSVPADNWIPKKTIVYFDFNKYNLRPQEQAKLDDIKTKTTVDKLIGYTDDIGSKKYNLLLSKKRVDTVAEYLVTIKKVKIRKIEAKGKSNFINAKTGKIDRVKSRRVEVFTECER